MKKHLFAHMDQNKVKKGDRVEAYKATLGTMGNGNGQWYAHLHHSISVGLTEKELVAYVIGWTKTRVSQYYLDPVKENVDYNKMFGTKMDVGNLGYGYLQKLYAPQRSYHPGIDVNGIGGGNSDFGMPFTSPVNGKVVYEVRTDEKNGGWGNIIIVEEEVKQHKDEPMKKELTREQKEILDDMNISVGDNIDPQDIEPLIEGLTRFYKMEELYKNTLRKQIEEAQEELKMSKQHTASIQKENDTYRKDLNTCESQIKVLDAQLNDCIKKGIEDDLGACAKEDSCEKVVERYEDCISRFDDVRKKYEQVVKENNALKAKSPDVGQALKILVEAIKKALN